MFNINEIKTAAILANEAAAAEQLRLIQESRKSRLEALNAALVITALGNSYDADEVSIGRMSNAILAAAGEADTYPMQWSLSDTASGVMTDITLADIKEAQRLAMQNMNNIWEI